MRVSCTCLYISVTPHLTKKQTKKQRGIYILKNKNEVTNL